MAMESNMSASQEAGDFLATSKSYLDGQSSPQQAAEQLGKQAQQMLANGTWVDALKETTVQSQGGIWNTTPVVDCSGTNSVEFTQCYERAAKTDLKADGDRSIRIEDREHDTVGLDVGHLNNGHFEVDATYNYPSIAPPTAVPFTDQVLNISPHFPHPLQDFPQASTTVVEDLGQLDRMVFGRGTDPKTVTNLYLNGGVTMDGISLRTLNAFPNTQRLFLNCNASDEDMKDLKGNPKIEEVVVGSDAYKLTAASLVPLSQLPKLTRLDLKEVHVGNDDLRYLTSDSLQELRLGNATTDGAFAHLAHLKNLRVLQIDDGDYTAQGVKQLAASSSLQRLVLQNPHHISPQKVLELKKALPGIAIDYVGDR
jgi:hypothetical protein